MVPFLEEWVLNIVLAAVFMVLLEIVAPSGKTRKFVKLIAGFVLIITITRPFIRFLGKNADIGGFHIASTNYLDLKEMENSSSYLNDEQIKQVIALYRKKLISQIEYVAKDISGVSEAEADVIINEDSHSEKFGEIRGAYIKLELDSEKKATDSTVIVEKVKIDGKKTTNENSDEVDERVKIELEDRIVRLFGVKKENIIVSRQMN